MASSREIHFWIRWTAGLTTAFVLVYMSYLSLQEDFTLSTPVIAGMLSVIVLLMYGSTELISLLEVWRGNRGGDSP